jgi:hypothetical protein
MSSFQTLTLPISSRGCDRTPICMKPWTTLREAPGRGTLLQPLRARAGRRRQRSALVPAVASDRWRARVEIVGGDDHTAEQRNVWPPISAAAAGDGETIEQQRGGSNLLFLFHCKIVDYFAILDNGESIEQRREWRLRCFILNICKLGYVVYTGVLYVSTCLLIWSAITKKVAYDFPSHPTVEFVGCAQLQFVLRLYEVLTAEMN